MNNNASTNPPNPPLIVSSPIWRSTSSSLCSQNEEQSTLDEAAHHRPIVIRHLDDPEEASVEAGGLVPEEVLDQADTREPGDVGHGRGRRGRGRRQGFERQAAKEAAKVAEAAENRGQPGRELLLLLADATLRLRVVQSVDVDRAPKFARVAGGRPRHVARLRRFHGPGLLSRRCRAIPYRLPRARFDGVQQQEAGRPLPQVEVVRAGPAGPVAPRPPPGESGQQPDAQVPEVSQDISGVQLLLHGRVEDGLPESVARVESDTHTAYTGALVRLLLLLAQRGGRIPRGLGLPVQAGGVRDPDQEVSRLALLVHPHPHHDRRPTHAGDQRRVSDNVSTTVHASSSILFFPFLRFSFWFFFVFLRVRWARENSSVIFL